MKIVSHLNRVLRATVHINVDGIFLFFSFEKSHVDVSKGLEYFWKTRLRCYWCCCYSSWNKSNFYWLFVFIILANKSRILAHIFLYRFIQHAKLFIAIAFVIVFYLFVGNKLDCMRNVSVFRDAVRNFIIKYFNV